ncbi:MAG: insulinase family protein [Elusimicrobia bacterium]|nr:insulinase family protein [Elusimicrobiota bacterium]
MMRGGAAQLALALALPVAAASSPRIDYTDFTLPNGLRVLVSTDHAVPVAAVSMVFDAGARHEARGRSGFAHLFEHMMFEGSQNVPKGAFDRTLESYGGDNNASTHQDLTFYYEEVPSNAVPVALWLDADRVGALDVSKDSVKNQIEVVKEEKRMRVDNKPYGPLLDLEMSSGTFSNWANAHPVIGSAEDLDAAGLDDVRDFFKAYYAPSNAIMAVVGDVDPLEVRRWVTELFGPLPNRPKPPAPDTAEPEPGPGRRFEVKDGQAKLPALALSWKGMPARGTPDFCALVLLGQALFDGKGSRLYQELVKTAKAAVDLSGGLGFPVSDLSDYKTPALFGAFIIHTAERKPEEVKALALAQVARVAAQGLPAVELGRVKTKFRSGWILGQQTALGRARKLLMAALLDGDPEAANGLDRYMAVTSEDIKRVAGKYLKSDLANTFVLIPGGAQ